MSIRMIEKFISYLITVWLVVTLTFFLMKLIPGDPFTDEQALPKEIHLALKKHYGLDDPWYKQYRKYVISLLNFDFGPSIQYKDRMVKDIIKEGFSVSFLLGLQSLLLSLSLGIILGTAGSTKKGSFLDFLVLILASCAVSVPSFILAALFQYLFSLKLGWFPVARWGSFNQSILPTLSLSVLPAAFIARLVRSKMIDVKRQSYIRSARAKGIHEGIILYKHALKNAILPVFSYLGLLITNITCGSFIIEKIFGIPGLGRWFVISVMDRDYPVIMALTVFYSFILLSITLIVDVSYVFVDPRIKREKACA